MVTVVNPPPGPRWVRPAKVVVETVSLQANLGWNRKKNPRMEMQRKAVVNSVAVVDKVTESSPWELPPYPVESGVLPRPWTTRKEKKSLLNKLVYAKRKAQETAETISNLKEKVDEKGGEVAKY